MKQVIVSDGAARLIDWLRTGKGMEETTGWLCDAFLAQVHMMGCADDLNGDDMLPLQVMAKYYALASELAMQPTEGEMITFIDNQDNV